MGKLGFSRKALTECRLAGPQGAVRHLMGRLPPQDPYFMKNHLGSYECKLCLTLHNNEVRRPGRAEEHAAPAPSSSSLGDVQDTAKGGGTLTGPAAHDQIGRAHV